MLTHILKTNIVLKVTDFPTYLRNLKVLHVLLFSRPHAKLVILFFAILSSALGILSPYFQKTFIDALSISGEAVQAPLAISPFFSVVFAFLALVIAQLCSAFLKWFCSRESAISQKWLGEKLYSHTLNLQESSRNKKTVGETVSMYAVDVQGATVILDEVLPLVSSSLVPILCLPLALFFLPPISLWPIMTVLLACLASFLFLGARQARFLSNYKIQTEERMAFVNEWLQNMRQLRILGWSVPFEQKILQKRRQETEARLTMLANASVMNAIGLTAPYAINLAACASLFWLGGNAITPGDVFGILWTFGVFLLRPMRTLPWILVFYFDSKTSAKRLESYFNLPSHSSESPNLVSAETLTDSVPESEPSKERWALEIENLTTSHEGKILLQDISLRIAQGEFVAIIGAVGAGKSLFLNSLLKDTQSTYGSYKIFGKDALAMPLETLRSHCAYVSQDGFMMSASLKDNVAFQYNSARQIEEAVSNSLDKAQFAPDLRRLEGGLSAELGERGVNLSGGQRQRIGIARAHFYDRSIFLLDDCLSALDVETEQKLTSVLLQKEWAGRTRVLVTHRLSVLPLVDKIFFFSNGTLLAEGTYEKLNEDSAEFRHFVTSLAKSDPELGEAM